ncbi:hypothetical protein L9G74_20075, partial [Shewanella sp. C32]|nr:hypothetical protein [Shewanella electrica]
EDAVEFADSSLFHPAVSFWRMSLLIRKALESDQMAGIDVRIQNSLKAQLMSNLFLLASWNFHFCMTLLFHMPYLVIKCYTMSNINRICSLGW